MANLLPLVCALWSCADPPPASPAAPMEIVAALEAALADAIEKAEPSVVAISRTKGEDGDKTTAVRGRDQPLPRNDAQAFARQFNPNANPNATDLISFDYGSGVVIGDRGEILTTFHVVKGAERLDVRAVGVPSFEALIIAADPRSDLAVIVPKVPPDVEPPKLRPMAIGDAARLRKGTFLVALGNPFNAARDGRPSASWGILSNVARRLELSLEKQPARRPQLRHYPTLLQLDSKLNLGMSGGAVVNLKGEMVGLTTALATAAGFDAMAGYAIPMDVQGRRIVETLRQGKEYEYGFLGIGLDLAGSNKVTKATPGTPADEGNVLVEDRIVAVGDIPVEDADSLVLAINTMPAGSKVRLKILRQDELIERTVELAKFRVDGEVIATNQPAAWRGLRVDYTSTLPDAPFGEALLTAMARGGVVVVEVEPGSPAARAGLRRGQFLRSVEGKTFKSPRDFARVVDGLGGPVSVETDLGAVTIKP